MKIEDNNLKNKLKENPFSTPEGYLEGLTDRIMKQIPKKHIFRKLNKFLFWIACVHSFTWQPCLPAWDYSLKRLPALIQAIPTDEIRHRCS